MKICSIDVNVPVTNSIENFEYILGNKDSVFRNNRKVQTILYTEEELAEMYEKWLALKKAAKKYRFRSPNLPEALSEGAFCLAMNKKEGKDIYVRITETSADCFNKETNELIQIKACSVEGDCTSFGPKTYWDRLFFLDFFSNGQFDGTFYIYEIESENIISTVLNKTKNETFRDQALQGRRPRFSIKNEIINKNKINPVSSYRIL